METRKIYEKQAQSLSACLDTHEEGLII